MLEYILEIEPKGALARVGRLKDLNRNREYQTPATSPVLGSPTEGSAMLRLLQDGLKVPAIFIPLSRRRPMKAHLGSLADSSLNTLDGFLQASDRPMVFVDPEAEALSGPNRARDAYCSDKVSPPPEQALPLLNTVLGHEARPPNRPEYGKVWDQALSKVGIASVGEWFEQMTRQAGGSAYLAPSPVIRANQRSVARAFRVVWRFVDAAVPNFDASGPHFVMYGDVFHDTNEAIAARAGFLAGLQQQYALPTPRKLPYVSLKIMPGGPDLFYGTAASQRRRNLSEFLMNVSHHARAMGAVLILHNFGTWALGGLDSGADIVSFRGDARPMYVDPIWRRQKVKPTSRAKPGRKLHRHRSVPPFDPDGLCDGSIKDFKVEWEKDGLHAFPSAAPFVHPEPFWEFSSYEKKFEYRTRQIIASLVAVGREYREALVSGEPIGFAVRSRIQRMRDQDPLIDLCPTVW